MSYCTNCGTKYSGKLKFCSNCGNKQEQIQINNPVEPHLNISKSSLFLKANINPDEGAIKNINHGYHKNLVLSYIFFLVFFVNILIPVIVISYPTLLLKYTENDIISESYGVSNHYKYNGSLWFLIFIVLILNVYLLFKFIGKKLIFTTIVLSTIYIIALYLNPVNFIGFSNHCNDESLFFSLLLMIINGYVLIRFINNIN